MIWHRQLRQTTSEKTDATSDYSGLPQLVLSGVDPGVGPLGNNSVPALMRARGVTVEREY
jgi:hypothetical protein